MRACFFFGAMVWTGFQLPAFLRLPFGVRSTTCDSQELSGAPLRVWREARGRRGRGAKSNEYPLRLRAERQREGAEGKRRRARTVVPPS